jgi:hypothetical protein
MKRKLVIALYIVLLVTTCFYVASFLKENLWSATGYIAFEQGKAEWRQGHIQRAAWMWTFAAERTVRDTFYRERAFSILRQSDAYIQEGKLPTALAYCKRAAQIYDEEGATSYHCWMIDQMINGTPTTVPSASPPP